MTAEAHVPPKTRSLDTAHSPRWSPAEVTGLALLPVAAFFLVHFTPIRQWSAIDPYVYMGYIHRFEDLIERFGLTYYSVRFGLILPSQLATALFGADGGYFVLRYVLVLLGGVPFYAVVRQNHSRPAAITAYAALVTSPFLARSLLWEYVDAVGVPAMLGSMSLLLLRHRRRIPLDVGAGILGGVALHSNVFIVAPLGAAVAGLAAGHIGTRGAAAAMAVRLALFTAGVALVSAAGSLYYGLTVGHYDIFSITLGTIATLNGQVARTAGAAWIGGQWSVLALPLLAMLAGASRGTGETAYRRSVIWIGALTAGFFYAHQFLLRSNTLELTYYYCYALPAVFLCLGLALGGCRPAGDRRREWLLVPAFLTPAVAPWVLQSYDLRIAFPATFAAFAIAAAGAAGIVCLATRRTGQWPWPAAGAAALGFLLFASFARPAYARMIDSRADPDRLEMDVHRAALAFMEFVPTARERPGAIRFWFSNDVGGPSMRSLQSTYLFGYTKVQDTDTPGLPSLTDAEAARIATPDVRYLMLIAEDSGQLPAARATLAARRLPHTVVAARDIRSGVYQVHLELLELRPR